MPIGYTLRVMSKQRSASFDYGSEYLYTVDNQGRSGSYIFSFGSGLWRIEELEGFSSLAYDYEATEFSNVTGGTKTSSHVKTTERTVTASYLASSEADAEDERDRVASTFVIGDIMQIAVTRGDRQRVCVGTLRDVSYTVLPSRGNALVLTFTVSCENPYFYEIKTFKSTSSEASASPSVTVTIDESDVGVTLGAYYVAEWWLAEKSDTSGVYLASTRLNVSANNVMGTVAEVKTTSIYKLHDYFTFGLDTVSRPYSLDADGSGLKPFVSKVAHLTNFESPEFTASAVYSGSNAYTAKMVLRVLLFNCYGEA